MANSTQKQYGNPYDLVGFDVPAADGGNYGHRVLSYDATEDEFHVIPIQWNTGKALETEPASIDAYKITYRYVPGLKRKSVLGGV